MEDFNSTISSQDISYDYSNFTSEDISYDYNNFTSDRENEDDRNYPWKVVVGIIISISLPLIFVAIYALYSQMRNDHVAPIYVINLLISDLIQLCTLIVILVQPEDPVIFTTNLHVFYFTLIASIGFMVCVALERYLGIACPLWYHFRRSIKTSVVVCVVVWAISLIFSLTVYFLAHPRAIGFLFGIVLLLPLPLFIFFLGGTIKALSASRVSSDEKRRIVGILVLVLLTYTLLFLPIVIETLAEGELYNETFSILSVVFVYLSPLADLVLYVFMRKGITDKLLASVCCCRMDRNDRTATHSSIL